MPLSTKIHFRPEPYPDPPFDAEYRIRRAAELYSQIEVLMSLVRTHGRPGYSDWRIRDEYEAAIMNARIELAALTGTNV